MQKRSPPTYAEAVNEENMVTLLPSLSRWNRQQKENCMSSEAPRRFVNHTVQNMHPEATIRCQTRSSSSPGRHIPTRNSMDIDQASFKLKKKPSITPDDVLDANMVEQREIRRRMACLSEGATEQNILSFIIDKNHGASRHKRLNSKVKGIFHQNFTYSKSRAFPTKPEITLDLPHFENNFFTHTIAWCSEDDIVAGIENCLFVCKADGGDCSLLSKLSENVWYSSVALKETFLACGTNDGGIELWDLKTDKNVEKSRHPHKDREAVVWPVSACRLGCLDWAPDSHNILISGCRNGQIDMWDKRLGLKVPVHTKSVAHPRGTICNIKYNNRGRYLASGDSGNMLKVWDMNNFDKPVLDKWAHTSAVRALAWHPEEPYLLVTGGGIDDGFIRVWNILKDQPKIKERYIKAQVCCLVWSPLTNELISSQALRGRNYTQNNQIFIWEYPEMRKIGNLLGHSGRVLHMDFSPSKTMLASAGGDETLRIWKMAKEKSKSKQWPTSSLKHTGFGCIR